MPNSDSIYTLYNDKINVDKTIVATIITAIKAQITTTANAETDPTFDFDLTPYIGSLQQEQQIRIKDSVIFYLRNVGFRSFLTFAQTSNPVVSLNFNSSLATNSPVIRIQWVVRKDTEFMKSYV